MANIRGTTGADTIDGTDWPDSIEGDAGNDILRGGYGGDFLYGGEGDDLLEGGEGDDWLYDGPGDDELRGERGWDYLFSEAGNDVLSGGEELNLYIVNRSDVQNDQVTIVGGTDYEDVSINSAGSSSFTISTGGGGGIVAFAALGGLAELSLGFERDTILLRETFATSVGRGTIHISGFEAGANGDRVDFLDFIAANLTGWDGTQNPFAAGYLRLIQQGADALLQFDLDGGGDGFATVIRFTNSDAATFGAENLGGYSPTGVAPPNRVITGTANYDYLFGGAGNDRINALEGSDGVQGGAGDDIIDGGADEDYLYGGIGNDDIRGGDGSDVIFGGYGHDTLSGGEGDDILQGEEGNDVVSDFDGGNDQLFGGNGYDQIDVRRSGTGPADTVLIDGGADGGWLMFTSTDRFLDTVTMIGGDHADLSDQIQVNGGLAVMVDARAGDDFVSVMSGGNVLVDLGAGSDWLTIMSNPSGLFDGVVTLAAAEAADKIQLGNFYRPIQIIQRGSDAVFQIDPDDDGAMPFQDLLVIRDATAGFIVYDSEQNYYQYQPPSSSPTDGNDLIYGDEDGNSIHAMGGNDDVFGFGGDDQLNGGAGDDVLDGGLGADTLIGGLGDDTYIIDNAGDVVTEGSAAGTDTVWSGVSYTLGANLEHLILLAGAINGTGNALANTITGNAGNNRLDGGAGADVMDGGAGHDTYIVDTSGDVVTDTGGGNDTVEASVSYTLGEGVEYLTLTGTGSINGTGNALNNILTGNSGNNILDGGAGADFMTGGLGDDIYVVDSGSDQVIEGAGGGTDTVRSGISHTLAANVENLTLAGTAALSGAGNALANVLTGNSGANVLNGNGGADRMVGLGGNDSYFIDDASDVIVEVAGGGADRIFATVSYVLRAGVHVETLSTTSAAGTAAINFAGNELANVIFGNAGANIINGGGGADQMAGYGGNDIYYVDNSLDVIAEAADAGIDRILASVSYTLRAGVHVETLSTTNVAGAGAINLGGNALANILYGNAGANILNGGGGIDQMAGYGGNDQYFVDHALDLAFESVGGGNDRVFASASYALRAGSEVEILSTTNNAGTAAINLGGNEFEQILYGNAGNNILNGGGGADTLSGFGGNDQYFVDQAGDRVFEAAGGGNDRIFASASYTLQAGSEVEILSTTSNAGTTAINLTGNAFGQILYGNAGDNILNGGGGADILSGLAGGDQYYVDHAGDHVYEAMGGGNDRILASVSYTLRAGSHVEILSTTDNAGTAAIGLTGNELTNMLIGNKGNNSLGGGLGADSLFGGAGNDRFVYNAAAESTAVSRDVIGDFEAGDLIDLSAIDANGDALDGDQAFAFLGAAAFSGGAGELRAIQDGANWLIQADLDGDLTADLVIAVAVVDPLYAITSADFVL